MIRFRLDGVDVALDLPPDRSLLSALREDLGRTTTKVGCEIGRCGACTILLDGEAVNACLLMLWQVEGRAVTTVDGLAGDPVAAAVMRGLSEENAFQCGYCAPGVVATLTGLFAADPKADATAIAAALEGNICRCTGYHSILRGALAAARLLEARP